MAAGHVLHVSCGLLALRSSHIDGQRRRRRIQAMTIRNDTSMKEIRVIGNGRMEGYAYLAAFIACIPIANWLIGHVGTVCVPNGPCLVPVAPGLLAPSGVLMVGLALVLRDLVQRRLGRQW